MTELYLPNEADHLSRRAAACRNAAWAVGMIGLAVCTALCFGIRPTNTVRRLTAVISISTLAGWAVILLVSIGFRPQYGAARHIRRLETEEMAEYSGILQKNSMLFQIPGSIVVQKIQLLQGDESRTLNVDARKRSLLPENGTHVHVQCRHSFITAFEVEHE